MIGIAFDFTQAGWFMVSLPVIPADSSVGVLFPSALGGNAYTWDPETWTYVTVTRMEPKKGYWLAIPSACACTVVGLPLNAYTTHFGAQGWYMIGSVMGGADFSNPLDNPDGLVFPDAYGWDAAGGIYAHSLTLNEKEGYWAAVFGECDLTVGGGGGGGGLSKASAVADWEAFFSKYGKTPPAHPSLQKEGLTSIPIPRTYGLSRNYPNPFNPETTIGYQMPETGTVRLVIYNTMGQVVRHLVEGDMPAGYHRAVWDGIDDAGNALGSGMYIVRMEAGRFTAMRKVMMMR
jgi:hypothetical protein